MISDNHWVGHMFLHFLFVNCISRVAFWALYLNLILSCFRTLYGFFSIWFSIKSSFWSIILRFWSYFLKTCKDLLFWTKVNAQLVRFIAVPLVFWKLETFLLPVSKMLRQNILQLSFKIHFYIWQHLVLLSLLCFFNDFYIFFLFLYAQKTK